MIIISRNFLFRLLSYTIGAQLFFNFCCCMCSPAVLCDKQIIRALSTLEGIARTLDPSFNVLQVMYPTALNRMMQNPSNSPVVDATLQNLISRSKQTGRIDRGKISKLLRDSALISGYSRRKVLLDVLRTRGGRRLIRDGLKEEFRYFVRRGGDRETSPTSRSRSRSSTGSRSTRRRQKVEERKVDLARSRRRRVSNYFRL